MKLGTNIKPRRRRIENKNSNSCNVIFFQNNALLKLLVSKSFPLYNFKTVNRNFHNILTNMK